MRRRGFLSTLGLITAFMLGSIVDTEAQQAQRSYRIGFLTLGGSNQDDALWEPLREHLRERGWVEGKNLVLERRYAEGRGFQDIGYVEGRNLAIEFRSAEGNTSRLPELAADLVRANADLLMASGTAGTRAAAASTSTLPS